MGKKGWVLLCLFVSLCSHAYSKDVPDETADCTEQVKNLSSLQGSIGFIREEEKEDRYRKALRKGHEDEFKHENKAPVIESIDVDNPDSGRLRKYFFDKTHDIAAIYQVTYDQALEDTNNDGRAAFAKASSEPVHIDVVWRIPPESLKEPKVDSFFRILWENKKIWPFRPEENFLDENNQFLPYEKIKREQFLQAIRPVWKLEDNPWRSLATALEGKVYRKIPGYAFQELIVGGEVRMWFGITADEIRNDMDGAVKKVRELAAKDPRAKLIPGSLFK